MMEKLKRAVPFLVLLALAVSAACSSSSNASTGSSSSGVSAPVTVNLGYFPNITHAPAIVGVEKGFFQQELGANTLRTQTFNAGGDAVTALLSGAIDATFVGPNPAINAYQKSNGDAVRVVAGSTSGGAALVVAPSINSVGDLKGKTLATPQLGNTQDVALRTYLKDHGLNTNTSGGGDVSITPLANADTLTAFANGSIAGAWVPEPYDTRLVQESGGKVLVDEASLWPQGQFVTTHLLVSKSFLDKHPDVVKDLIKGEADAIDFIKSSPADAKTVINDGLNKLTGKPLKDAVITQSLKDLTFTLDPIASSLQTSADHASAVGLLDKVDLKSPGIYDLTLLNQVLRERSQPAVQGL
jgi:NitT/TauT family transport system substrate-binding protein